MKKKERKMKTRRKRRIRRKRKTMEAEERVEEKESTKSTRDTGNHAFSVFYRGRKEILIESQKKVRQIRKRLEIVDFSPKWSS
jgi:hypothetical protein